MPDSSEKVPGRYLVGVLWVFELPDNLPDNWFGRQWCRKLANMGPTGGRKRSKSAFSRAGEVVSAHFAANVIWRTRKAAS